MVDRRAGVGCIVKQAGKACVPLILNSCKLKGTGMTNGFLNLFLSVRIYFEWYAKIKNKIGTTKGTTPIFYEKILLKRSV
jgi:hypothetical protein